MTAAEKERIEFAERLNKVLDDKGYPMRGRAQKVLAETKLNISDRAINKWLKGESIPDHSNLAILSRHYGVGFDWLATGNGEMTTKPSIRMAIDDPDSMPPALRDHLTADHGDDELDTDNTEAMLERYVPVISWVAAGDMTPVLSTCLTDVMEWIPRPSHLSKMAFGLVIRGRSMMPEFKPDEIIYVEPEFNPYWLRDGDLVVVSCDGDSEATFKQLVMGETSEDMYLKPLNPEWHNQEIRPMNECRLVGVVDGKYVRYRKQRQWN